MLVIAKSYYMNIHVQPTKWFSENTQWNYLYYNHVRENDVLWLKIYEYILVTTYTGMTISYQNETYEYVTMIKIEFQH